MLFCGTWDSVKGTPYLVRAFDQLAAEGAPGAADDPRPGLPAADVLALFATRRGHTSRSSNGCRRNAWWTQYRRHDALVFPSTYEGFGLVALEAMSQGLPIDRDAGGLCARPRA